METVQMGLVTMILLVVLPCAVLLAVVMMVGFGCGAGVAGLVPVWIGWSATGGRVAIEPAGDGDPGLYGTGSAGTVFFDKEDSLPERRVLYPALFVYGPTSLAR